MSFIFLSFIRSFTRRSSFSIWFCFFRRYFSISSAFACQHYLQISVFSSTFASHSRATMPVFVLFWIYVVYLFWIFIQEILQIYTPKFGVWRGPIWVIYLFFRRISDLQFCFEKQNELIQYFSPWWRWTASVQPNYRKAKRNCKKSSHFSVDSVQQQLYLPFEVKQVKYTKYFQTIYFRLHAFLGPSNPFTNQTQTFSSLSLTT